MSEYETDHANDLNPWHPLVHLALARLRARPPASRFSARYSRSIDYRTIRNSGNAQRNPAQTGKRGFGAGSESLEQ
jgi:hypothetical protein